MTWLCSECGQEVTEEFVYVGVDDVGWLCSDCKSHVDWKQMLDVYDEDGNYTGS